jgi:hypothetical protein
VLFIQVMKPFFYLILALFFFSDGVSAQEGANEKILLLDSFDISDTDNINQSLELRQEGTLEPLSYREVTFGPAATTEEGHDSFRVESQALELGHKFLPGKGPATLALNYDFGNAGKTVITSLEFKPLPGKCSWLAVKWAPEFDGLWPNLSTGINIVVDATGNWNLFNPTRETGGQENSPIAHGLVEEASTYRMNISYTKKDDSHFILSFEINEIKAVTEMEVAYESPKCHLNFQALASKIWEPSNDLPKTLRIDQLKIISRP